MTKFWSVSILSLCLYLSLSLTMVCVSFIGLLFFDQCLLLWSIFWSVSFAPFTLVCVLFFCLVRVFTSSSLVCVFTDQHRCKIFIACIFFKLKRFGVDRAVLYRRKNFLSLKSIFVVCQKIELIDTSLIEFCGRPTIVFRFIG